MLLIVTNSGDSTVDFALPAIAGRGIEHRRLNTDQYPGQVGVLADGLTSRLALADGAVDLDALSAIWWRRPTPPRIEGRDPAVAHWAQGEARAALDGLWPVARATRWVNHPEHNRRGEEKIRSLRLAARLGFTVPEWIVTNEPGAAIQFAERQPEGVVAKAMLAGRIDERRTLWSTHVEHLSALEAIGPEPCFLQRLVHKCCDVRHTVIGEYSFAVRIDASQHPDGVVDWRRAPASEVRYAPSSMAAELERRCHAMMRELGLRFAAFDFALDQDGEHQYLEINPNGQWAWIEQATGLPMAERLAELLDA